MSSTSEWLGDDGSINSNGNGKLVNIKMTGLDNAISDMSRRYPSLLDRAVKSALSSTGNMIRSEVRNHIEYGGTGWPELHALTARYRDYKGWKSRSIDSPLFWLGKFARYSLDKQGRSVTIGLGTTRKGQKGKVDRYLTALAYKHERGARVTITPRMRKKWASTWKKNKKRQRANEDYFVLRKETRQIEIPKRPTFGPVFRKVQGKIPGHMRQKFFAAFERYLSGGSKK